MPIATKFIQSTHSANSKNNLGGAIGVTEVVPASLFDLIQPSETSGGHVDFRCFFLKMDTGTSDLISGVVTRTVDASNANVSLSIGLAPEGINGTPEQLTDETTVPTGVTFGNTVNIPATMTDGDYIGVWVRRTVTAGAGAGPDSGTLEVTGVTDG